jgi:hypothetical protein
MSASSTSSPFVIFSKATSTPVFVPPFRNRCPLADATTIGLTACGISISGAFADRGRAAAATPAAAVEARNVRRSM